VLHTGAAHGPLPRPVWRGYCAPPAAFPTSGAGGLPTSRPAYLGKRSLQSAHGPRRHWPRLPARGWSTWSPAPRAETLPSPWACEAPSAAWPGRSDGASAWRRSRVRGWRSAVRGPWPDGAATPPDTTAQWMVAGRMSCAQVWNQPVLSMARPGAPTLRCAVIHDPRYYDPLVLATNLPVSAHALWGLYRHRWPIEQLPLAAKQMSGAHRAFVCRGESRHRLPEVALLAGNVLAYGAATRQRWRRAFGIGATVRPVGTCVGCCYAWIFPQFPCRKAHYGTRRR
jgi:hypothetical protein